MTAAAAAGAAAAAAGAAALRQPEQEERWVLDGNGDPVPVPDGIATETAAQFFAGRVPAPDCPHYMAQSEVLAGFTTCERCSHA